MVILNGFNGSCDTLNDRSGKICVPKKTKDKNLNVFNIIAKINESKTLKKHTHVVLNANLMVKNVLEIKSRIMINSDMSAKPNKTSSMQKNNIRNPSTCASEIYRYLKNITDTMC